LPAIASGETTIAHNRIVCLVGALAALVAQTALAQQVQGTWQLVEVLVPSVADSNPRGIPTVKEHYTADGRLYFIAPTEVMSDTTQWVTCRIEGAKRTVRAANGRTAVATLSFPDPETLIVTQRGGDQWRYTRLKGDDAPNRRLEPLSVEVLKTSDADNTSAFRYDDRDYSSQPLKKRVIGVWEVIAYRNVPIQDAPPYGFLNDVWIFDTSSVSIVVRMRGSEQKGLKLTYSLKDGKFEMQSQDSPVRVTFDAWGHMVLDFGNHTIVLKLITKNAAQKATLPPVKVALMSLQGEKADE
jgi:hypothetical protein